MLSSTNDKPTISLQRIDYFNHVPLPDRIIETIVKSVLVFPFDRNDLKFAIKTGQRGNPFVLRVASKIIFQPFFFTGIGE